MFAGFASTTPTDTHSVYRTFHFVFGVEHILSTSAPGHSTNRLLSYHFVIGTVLVPPCLRQPPTFTACSTTVCDALPCGRLYSYIRFCTTASVPQTPLCRKHTTRTLHAKRGTTPQAYNYTPAQPHRKHRYA